MTSTTPRLYGWDAAYAPGASGVWHLYQNRIDLYENSLVRLLADVDRQMKGERR